MKYYSYSTTTSGCIYYANYHFLACPCKASSILELRLRGAEGRQSPWSGGARWPNFLMRLSSQHGLHSFLQAMDVSYERSPQERRWQSQRLAFMCAGCRVALSTRRLRSGNFDAPSDDLPSSTYRQYGRVCKPLLLKSGGETRKTLLRGGVASVALRA